MKNKYLIAIIGPTAIGKTALSIKLASHFNAEIISADSRQFFKEMRIGTAVPSVKELAQANHHFIQHKSIFDSYSVGDFEKEAIIKLDDLFSKNNVVIMVGGSGLYVDAVVKGLDHFPEVDPSIREELNSLFEKEGITSLQTQLQTLDPEYAQRVDMENSHRLIRALEICIGTGKPYSSFLSNPNKERTFKTIKVGLTADRQIVYDRINRRVDIMIDEGLLEEAKALHKHKSLNALQTVGYKELFHYFEGEWDLDFTISEIKKNTRRFAKRQFTWFKKDETTLWFDYEAALEEVLKALEERIS
ncbi:tRNA (adenosine(37)-N6)-dimethylallyltransferase MiaA [Spongiivirga citrea]|uniref:tRNA dimethylallyltransferase n=1 Tax=Spongiivirga citrea TaxID=1481457 RepID=A0A6M0CI06_9FLAO|nr:tRNA (adenosine(37)-N6)-dimethylallyltransferase MiaA [Spongiivirga citrea]NER17598.1 tRNA (adenosine(37)-N6)-dimethylallyltransferase MiaA [Spongiivirga citrea]